MLPLRPSNTGCAAVVIRGRFFTLWHCATAALFLLLLLHAAGSANSCLGQDSTTSALTSDASRHAVAEGQRALQTARLPWYDPSTDGLRRFETPITRGNATRPDWRVEVSPDWNWNWNGQFSFSWLGQVLEIAAWCLLLGLLGLLVYVLIRTYLEFRSLETGLPDGSDSSNESVADQLRIDALPVSLSQRSTDLLSIAAQYYQQHDYANAIVYLFSYRLVQLDRAGYIRLAKGKTNRQYVIEIARSRELQAILGQTTVAFEDVFFGRHDLTRERFESCWKRNDQFRAMVQQVLS